jgi:hypothetical protein
MPMTAYRVIRIACAFACVAGTMTSVACDGASAPVGPSSSPADSSGPWQLSGVAVGDDARPIANAPVSAYFFQDRVTGSVTAVTDEMGRYHLSFYAPEGGFIYRSTATVRLDAGADYEREGRWFRPASSDRRQTLDLRPRRIWWISAGESVLVTVERDASQCFNNVQDGTGGATVLYLCRTVRFVVPSDGVLTVEAVSTDAGASPPLLEVEGDRDELDCCYLGNPLSMPVTAGTIMKVNVEIPEGSPTRTFALSSRIR